MRLSLPQGHVQMNCLQDRQEVLFFSIAKICFWVEGVYRWRDKSESNVGTREKERLQ